jgi:protein TonB
MRKDLVIGLLFSGSLHWSALYLTQAPSAPKKHEAGVADVLQIEMPKLEAEEPEKKASEEPQDEDAVVSTIAPPSLVEIPNVVPNAVFVMTPEPPPPPGIQTSKGVVTIPASPRPAGWGRSFANLFDVSQLDQKPEARINPSPEYPYEARRNNIEGTVLVGFICDINGDVRDAYVISSAHHELDASAVRAISRWKFKPGKRGGKVVNAKMSLPFEFKITN